METLVKWAWVFAWTGLLALIGFLSTWYAFGWQVEGPPTYFAVGSAMSFILYAVFDRDNIQGTVKSRQFGFTATSALSIVLAGALAVASFVLVSDHDQTWDLTTDARNSLSPQTEKIIKAIEQPVTIEAYFRSKSSMETGFREVVRRYEDLSPQISVVYIDPLQEPLKAQQANITSEHGTVIVKSGDKDRRLESSFGEEALTQAIVNVQSTEDHRICWSIGHGEIDPDDEYSAEGLGGVVLKLEGLNYQVTRTLIATEGIDRACEVLVVARPVSELLPFEREAVAAYVAEGGRLFVMLDVGLTPDWAAEMERYGVSIGEDIVLDLNPQNMMMGVQDPSFVVLTGANFLPHDITRNLSAAVVLGISRSVMAAEDPPEGFVVKELLETSPEAWAETDFESEPQPDEGIDRVGSIPVMAAVEVLNPESLGVATPSAEAPARDQVEDTPTEAPATEEAPAAGEEPASPAKDGPVLGGFGGEVDLEGNITRAIPADFSPKEGGRVVVLGDATFASNQFLEWGNNADLFLNTIAWLVEEEAQIGARPRKADILQLDAVDEALLCLVSTLFVPGIAVLLALATLLRRRYL